MSEIEKAAAELLADAKGWLDSDTWQVKTFASDVEDFVPLVLAELARLGEIVEIVEGRRTRFVEDYREHRSEEELRLDALLGIDGGDRSTSTRAAVPPPEVGPGGSSDG